MKKVLTFLVAVVFMLCSASIGAEPMKTLPLPGTELTITVPEVAPEFFDFPTQILGAKEFSNGNTLLFAESMNKEQTVDVISVFAKIGDKISILAIQVSYCPEGFSNFNEKKKHVTDYYEDSIFMKTGKISGILVRVDKLTNFKEFSKFVAGV